jgi:hypothetical protein
VSRLDDKDATPSASGSDPDYALDRRDLDHLRDAERLGDLQRVTQSAIHVSALDDSGLLWVIAEYSCAIDVASAFLVQVYGSAPISSRHF